MRHIRVLIGQVDEGTPDLMSDLACFDLATPDMATLQPETALDALEAAKQETGTTVLRRLLHAQWDQIDAALVARHCAQGAVLAACLVRRPDGPSWQLEPPHTRHQPDLEWRHSSEWHALIDSVPGARDAPGLVNYRFAGSSKPWFSVHAEHGVSGDPASPQRHRSARVASLRIIHEPCAMH